MNENCRILRFKNIDSFDSLKVQILDALKINNLKKTGFDEFEERLSKYLERQPKLAIQIEVSTSKVLKSIQKRIESEKKQPSIPDNYEFGNPINRWIYELEIKTQEEIEIEIEKIQLEN